MREKRLLEMCPGGKYTHDDSLNHLRKKHEAPNHLRAAPQRSTLFYIILCLTTIHNILFPNCFKLQATRLRRAHAIIEEGVHLRQISYCEALTDP